jgi:hypothetical protein
MLVASTKYGVFWYLNTDKFGFKWIILKSSIKTHKNPYTFISPFKKFKNQPSKKTVFPKSYYREQFFIF